MRPVDMTYDPGIHHRRSIRLPGYDYASPGAYFVTLCTRNMARLFGRVVEGEMTLTECGKATSECCRWLGRHFGNIELDAWILMPNHLHAIVVYGGGSRTAPTKPLGRLIGAFKTVSTRQVNAILEAPGAVVWQRNYYERVIRNGNELSKIREYIAMNPLRWACDRYNPEGGVAVREETKGFAPWEDPS